MSREEHDIVLELLPAYALDALDEEEKGRVERHLRVCPRCQAELHLLKETAHLLAYTVPLYDPPFHLRERIRLLVATGRPSHDVSPRGGLKGVVRTAVWARPTPLTALVLILSLITLGLFSWNIHLKGELASLRDETVDAHELGEVMLEYVESPDNYELHPIQATDASFPAHGIILSDRLRRRMILLAKGLPRLENDEAAYMVWIQDERGHAIPIRAFHCDEQGRAVLLFTLPKEPQDIVEIGVSIAQGNPPMTPVRPVLDGKLR